MPVTAGRVPLGSRMPWFDLTDLDGKRRASDSLAPDRPVLLVLLCQHSPYVRHIEMHLGNAMTAVLERGVTVLGIASNDWLAYPTDDRAGLIEQVERADFRFPYCLDVGQKTARALGATCTPEFFLFDAPDGHLVYHGQYDKSRPGNDVPTTGEDLLAAVNLALIKDVVSPVQEPSFGCSIKWTDGRVPAYLSVLED